VTDLTDILRTTLERMGTVIDEPIEQCDKCKKDYPRLQVVFYPQWGPDGEREETPICKICERYYLVNGEWRT
jgi:hypothetical protein